VIYVVAFFGCTSLRVVIIGTGCRLREKTGLKNIKTFIGYEDQNDVKAGRRLFHLGLGGGMKNGR
jgi:hypothetical protein